MAICTSVEKLLQEATGIRCGRVYPVAKNLVFLYLIKAKGPEATYIAVQLQNTNKQYARLLTWATT